MKIAVWVGVLLYCFVTGYGAVAIFHRLTETPHVCDASTASHGCDTSAARLVARVFDLPEVPEKVTTLSMRVTVSAYTARAEECDSTPEVTADMTPSRVGILAVSPDMREEIGLNFGDVVALIDGDEFLGVFKIHDVMNRRFTRRVDILHGNVRAALLFGIRRNVELIRVIGDSRQ